MKLSEHLAEKCPDVSLPDAKKVIIAYRDYMFILRNGSEWPNFCDVCYTPITKEESEKTTIYDFNYCCSKHSKYKSCYQLDKVRSELGITIEHLPHLDIYE